MFCDACGEAVAGAGAHARAQGSSNAPQAAPSSYTPRHLAEKILTQRGGLEGEPKNVTVLFADLAGFASLSKGRSPGEFETLMELFSERLLDEVHHHEGMVNQLRSDGAMVLFGTPITLVDAPRRAIIAALGIQRRVAALAAEHRVDLPLRIGIHSGQIIIEGIDDDLRMEYTAVGDSINLAARIQGQAPPGAIWISDGTERLVAEHFDLEDVGERNIRGESDAVRIFRVVGERSATGRIDAIGAAGLTPLIGRDREIAEVQNAFDQAREGHGRACFIVGDAGIGKSRLLYEFRRGLGDEPHVWFEGRCAPSGSTTAFGPIVDGLRRLFGITDRDDDRSALEKLERGVVRFGSELSWTLPFLQRLLDRPVIGDEVEALDPASRRSETIRALHALFGLAAEELPLIFMVEDLHWIDAASEEFLTSLIDSIPGARMCLLLTHRPGYDQPFGDRSYHVQIAVSDLSASEMASIAGSLMASDEVPGDLCDLIAAKARGNPFFVEEVTKSLLEDGALALREGKAVLDRDVSDISISNNIQDVLMARLNRLDEEPKRAIQIAAVIGREFPLRLLERIMEAGGAVEHVVDALRDAELIYRKADHPEPVFLFKSALTHDVAYDSILLQKRRALHRSVGTSIELLYEGQLSEHYEALAHHFERANEWDRALLYHERVAKKARDAYANHSASEHYRKALEIAKNSDWVLGDQRGRLAEGLGEVCYALNEFRASGDAYVLTAREAAVPELRARNLGRAAHAYFWGHHYDESELIANEAIAIATKHGYDAALAIASNVKSDRLLMNEGLAALQGLGHTDAFFGELAQRSGDDEAIAYTVSFQGLWSEMRGEYHQSLERSELALASAQRVRSTALMLIPTWVIGLSLTCLGEYERAIAKLGEALALAQRIGDRVHSARLFNTLGWCYGEIGCHSRASEYNRQSQTLARELLDLALEASVQEIRCNAAINLAGNFIVLGDVDAADALLEPIWTELDSEGDPWQRWRYRLHALDTSARIAIARGDHARALYLVEGEIEDAQKHASKEIEARALELRGRTLLHQDRLKEASRDLATALGLARQIGYPPVVWRSLALRAEIARRGGNTSSAEREASEARELVSSLAKQLSEAELREEFGALGERLATDPLAVLV